MKKCFVALFFILTLCCAQAAFADCSRIFTGCDGDMCIESDIKDVRFELNDGTVIIADHLLYVKNGSKRPWHYMYEFQFANKKANIDLREFVSLERRSGEVVTITRDDGKTYNAKLTSRCPFKAKDSVGTIAYVAYDHQSKSFEPYELRFSCIRSMEWTSSEIKLSVYP